MTTIEMACEERQEFADLLGQLLTGAVGPGQPL